MRCLFDSSRSSAALRASAFAVAKLCSHSTLVHGSSTFSTVFSCSATLSSPSCSVFGRARLGSSCDLGGVSSWKPSFKKAPNRRSHSPRPHASFCLARSVFRSWRSTVRRSRSSHSILPLARASSHSASIADIRVLCISHLLLGDSSGLITVPCCATTRTISACARIKPFDNRFTCISWTCAKCQVLARRLSTPCTNKGSKRRALALAPCMAVVSPSCSAGEIRNCLTLS
mmetsp:Transcript_50529/g.100560  ORF Transcript_50529/g.100560 Transcript_50529/m.100560 type:complete len:230 (+) Transcript_50529:664-1353(+)